MAQLKQTPSRGDAVSAYLPCFGSPATSGGAKIYGYNMRAAFLSGTISGLLSGVVAVAHGLGVVPKFVVVGMKAAHADIIDPPQGVHVSNASAATSTNIYLKTRKSGNVKYVAYVQL